MCVCVFGFHKYSGLCQAAYVLCVFLCACACVQNVYDLYVQSGGYVLVNIFKFEVVFCYRCQVLLLFVRVSFQRG